MNNISKKHILIFLGLLLAIGALLDLGAHKGETKDTVVGKIANTVVEKLSQKNERGLMAPNTTRPPVSIPEEKISFSITSDPTLLKGEAFFYIEGGILYRRKIENGVAAKEAEKIAEGVYQILVQNEKVILFNHLSTNPHAAPWERELWIIDKELGRAKSIYHNVLFANLSLDGERIVLAVGGSEEIHLTDRDGNLIQRVGIHGSDPIFSPDGRKIAYLKLGDFEGDGSPGLGPYGFKGIALYDLATGRETMVSTNPDDYVPITFSYDGNTVFFISSRDGGHTIWSVDTTNKTSSAATRLTPQGENVYIGNTPIWFSSQLSVISETSGKISLVQILPDKKSALATELGEGTAPRWKVQDKIIEFNGKDGWKEVEVSSFLKK